MKPNNDVIDLFSQKRGVLHGANIHHIDIGADALKEGGSGKDYEQSKTSYCPERMYCYIHLIYVMGPLRMCDKRSVMSGCDLFQGLRDCTVLSNIEVRQATD